MNFFGVTDKQRRRLQQWDDAPPARSQAPPKVPFEEEKRITEAAKKIIATPMPEEERQQQLAELLRDRTVQLQHVPSTGIKGTAIFFNMKQIGIPPTPLCPAYNKMRLPTVSSYHVIGISIASILLDPSALQHVPPHVLGKIGDRSGEQLQLFCTVIDGRQWSDIDPTCKELRFQDNDIKLNLVTHPWAHPHALLGDDVKFDVNMGIFPEIGSQSYKGGGAVAFNGISPMEVYTHGTRTNMRYSPDNAHFQIIPGSPFAIFWTVAQKDDRAAITKMLVIFDYNHPICKPLIASTRDCDCLATHLKRLEGVKDGIQRTFANAIHLFEQENPAAMEEFKKLPLAFQYGIFKETWTHFGSPTGIHGDFGAASFFADSSLKQEFHCNDQQRAAVIGAFAAHLQNLLLDSQIDLTQNSQTLIKGDNVLKMMECAQLFKMDRKEEGMKLFEQFSKEEKEAVYLACWELRGCPRGDSDYGTKFFMHLHTYHVYQAEALYLAASRLAPRFELAVEETKAPEGQILDDKGKEKEEQIEAENVDEKGKEKEELPGADKTDDVAFTSSSISISPHEVLQSMMTMAFDGNFSGLETTVRTSMTMDLFGNLPQEIQNTIYGKVYERSQDPHKGGPKWGELHVADDLNVLVDALSEVLGS